MQTNVLEYLERTALDKPTCIALSERSREITFAKLRSSSLALAQRILNHSNVTCNPIGVFLPKCIESIVAFAGALYSGNFYVPLDTKTPENRLKAILENLAPCCVVTNSNLLPTLLKSGFPKEKAIIFDDFRLDKQNENDEIASRFTSLIDTDPVYVIYTSGSTGIPKGVTIPHRGVIDYIDWANTVYSVNSTDVIGSQAPLYFDNSTLDIYLCFSRGARLHLIPDDTFTFPVKLIEHLRDFGITTIFWVPSILTTVANFDILSKISLPAIRNVLFAGEAMPAKTLNYWLKHLPNALFSNLYGPTEITVDCTYYIISRPIADDEPVPIGFPCRNSDILILNESDCLASLGEIGELCVRGSSLALGYWNAPAKTAESFVQNPLRTQYPDRIYRTGDLVLRNQLGEIIFLGRKDSQIKHQGHRIELGEIEVAANAIDGIRTCCVLYNSPKQEITLFYESEQEFHIRELREMLCSKLPRYMVPTIFRHLYKIPLNANGKIDRPKLASTYF